MTILDILPTRLCSECWLPYRDVLMSSVALDDSAVCILVISHWVAGDCSVGMPIGLHIDDCIVVQVYVSMNI